MRISPISWAMDRRKNPAQGALVVIGGCGDIYNLKEFDLLDNMSHILDSFMSYIRCRKRLI